MTASIVHEVFEHAPVESGTLLVMLALAENADEKRTCFPGVPYIARKTRLQPRQVQNCVRRLREMGLIEVQRNRSNLGTNLYTITPWQTWPMRNGVHPSAETPMRNGVHPRYAMECVSDAQSSAPKPSVEPSVEPSDSREDDLFSASTDPQPTGAGGELGSAEKREDPDSLFDEAWDLFPKKSDNGSKKNAKAKFRAAIQRKRVSPKDLMRTIRLYRAARDEACRTGKSEPRFTKAMERWLASECWVGLLDAPEASDRDEAAWAKLDSYKLRTWDMGAVY